MIRKAPTSHGVESSQREPRPVTLDEITELFERPATADEHCRAFAGFVLRRYPVALCAVVLGTRNALRVAFVSDREGRRVVAQGVVHDATTLDGVFEGDILRIGARDPWPTGVPFGPWHDEIASTGAALFLPLYIGANVRGFATLQGAPCDFTTGEVDELRPLARILALALSNAQLTSDVELLSQKSSIDALTGVLNRRAFDERLRTEWRRAVRERTSVAIALLDVDQFKMYNDTYGHQQGDECLRWVVRAIAEIGLRPGDFIARYGGEEFAVVMPGSDEAGALALCDRMRLAIAERALQHEQSQHGVITVSIGVAAACPDAARAPSSLLYEADTALYRAKQAGRNRVAGEQTIHTSPLGAARSLLPALPHGFIGRSEQLEILAALEEPLVTIAGPAGIGKTALALEFAHRTSERAVFVDLAHVERGEGVESTVAAALAIEPTSSQRLLASIRDRTRHERLLLLLDRCEHVLAAVAEFAISVRDIQGVRILATSREPLHVDGEEVLRLGPLDPDDALAFFERCAREANPDITIDRSERDVMRRLIAQLDAVPLAIEFAAHALREYAFEELETKLARAGESGSVNAVDAAVASSYLLLSPEEKRVFMRMAVFPGDCSVEAARAVSDDRSGDILRRLVDKSLLVADAATGRLRMLSATREFAAARLRAHGDYESSMRAHARHYITLLPDQSLSASPERLDLVLSDRHNYDAALERAKERGDSEIVAELIARLSVTYLRTLSGEAAVRGFIDAGRSIAEGDVSLELRLRALAVAGYAAYLFGDLETLQTIASDLERYLDRISDPYTVYSVTVMKYIAKVAAGDHQPLLTDAETVIAVAENTGSPRVCATTFYNLALWGAEAGSDFFAAEAWAQRGLEYAAQGAEELTLALATIAWRMGDEETAAARFAQVLQAMRSGGRPPIADLAPIKAANFELWRGNVDDALALLLDVLRLIRRAPAKRATVGVLDAYVHAACRRSELDVAVALHAFVGDYRAQHGLRRTPFGEAKYAEVIARYQLRFDPTQARLATADQAFAAALTI
jgi:diguanylate cyclase (GGDEF)-like protein